MRSLRDGRRILESSELESFEDLAVLKPRHRPDYTQTAGIRERDFCLFCNNWPSNFSALDVTHHTLWLREGKSL